MRCEKPVGVKDGTVYNAAAGTIATREKTRCIAATRMLPSCTGSNAPKEGVTRISFDRTTRSLTMKRRILAALALAAAACFAGSQARADVKPHALFSDGMVLQQGMKCPISGKAAPGESVNVTFTATKTTANTASSTAASAGVTADQDGKWMVAIQVAPEMAGGPYEMVIKGKNTITLKNVY